MHYNAPVGIELKDDIRQFTVRGNTTHDIQQAGIGGNMHEITTSGEIVFNNSRAGIAVDINQDGMAHQIYVQRNTLVGRVQVRNTDAADGPFRFSNNVIVNGDSGTPAGSHITNMSTVDASRVLITNNTTGTSSNGIVDASGLLTNTYAQYRGVRGYELGNVVRPRPPTGLTAQ